MRKLNSFLISLNFSVLQCKIICFMTLNQTYYWNCFSQKLSRNQQCCQIIFITKISSPEYFSAHLMNLTCTNFYTHHKTKIGIEYYSEWVKLWSDFKWENVRNRDLILMNYETWLEQGLASSEPRSLQSLNWKQTTHNFGSRKWVIYDLSL